MSQSGSNDRKFLIAPEALEHARQVCAFAGKVFDRQPCKSDEGIRIFAMAHAWRMLRHSQAITVLIGSGLTDSAGAVARVLLEQLWVIQALHKEPALFSDLTQEGLAGSGKALKGLSRLPPDEIHPEITARRLADEIEKLPTASSFQAWNWAGRAVSTGTYLTLYATLSTFAHGGPAGTVDYLRPELGSEGVRIAAHPDSANPFDFLMLVCEALLDTTDIVYSASLSDAQRIEAARLRDGMMALLRWRD